MATTKQPVVDPKADPMMQQVQAWFKKLHHPDGATHKIAFARRNPEMLKVLCPGD